MSQLEPLDAAHPVISELDIEAGPVVLINRCTMAPEDEQAFLSAWTADALYMKEQPGFISTQLHRALGDDPTYVNYAIFESAAAWRAAVQSPEFQEKLKLHPASVTARPQLFRKIAVSNLCVA